MKTIINYFKKRKEKQLKAKIALNESYAANELEVAYGFVRNNDSDQQSVKINLLTGFEFGDQGLKVNFISSNNRDHQEDHQD